MTLPYEPANVPTDSIGVQSLIAVTESFLRSSTPGETSPYSLSDLSIQHLNSAAHIFALTQQTLAILERSASHSLPQLVAALRIFCARRKTELQQLGDWLGYSAPTQKTKIKTTADLIGCLDRVKGLLYEYRLYQRLNQCAAWYAEAGGDWESAQKFQVYAERMLQDLHFLDTAYKRASGRVQGAILSERKTFKPKN